MPRKMTDEEFLVSKCFSRNNVMATALSNLSRESECRDAARTQTQLPPGE